MAGGDPVDPGRAVPPAPIDYTPTEPLVVVEVDADRSGRRPRRGWCGRVVEVEPARSGRPGSTVAQCSTATVGARHAGSVVIGGQHNASTTLVVDFVTRLVAYLGAHAPPGRLASSRGRRF